MAYERLQRELEEEHLRQAKYQKELEEQRKRKLFEIPPLPAPQKPDNRRPIELTTKSSHLFSGVPLYSQVTDEAYFNFSPGKIRGRKPNVTGNVKFYLCEEEDLEPGGPFGVGGGCPIGKGKHVDTSIVEKYGNKWMSVSNPTIADQIGKYCWRAEYSGDDNYKPIIHTSPSLKDECFITTRYSQAKLPEGYTPPPLKRRPPGRPRVITLDDIRQTIKERGIITPLSLKESLDLRDETEARHWIEKVENEEIVKHPVKDEWRYRSKTVKEHFIREEEKEKKRIRDIKLRKEHEFRKGERKEKLETEAEISKNIDIDEEVGLVISGQHAWDATPKFKDDVKRLDFNLRRALERRIDRIQKYPERGSLFTSVDYASNVSKLISVQCPMKVALHSQVTAQYRIVWCIVGDKVRFLRFVHVGDSDYDVTGTH